MNKKLDIHNFWCGNVFIILTFAIMSILSGILLFHSHFFAMVYDFDFHWLRINDLRESILHGNWNPLVALNEFNQTGSATMAMYPKINIYPIALLSLFIKSSTTLIHASLMLRNFFALILGYYSCYCYTKNKQVSFLFSTAYTLTTMALYYCIGVYGIGTSSSMIFLPLVLFGFLELVRFNKWVELTVGMSGIILSHILSSGLVIIFLAIMLLVNISAFKKFDKWISLFKSIVVTILCTSIFWFSFIMLSHNNSMNIPTGSLMNGNDFSFLISAAMNNNISSTLTLSGLMGLILSVVNYKKLSITYKKIFWISILFLFICSQAFPWSILSHTLVDRLQFPNRIYIIPEVLLCFLFAHNFIILCRNKKHNFLILIGAVLSIIILQMGAQETLVNSTINNPRLITLYSGNTNVKLQDNSDYNNILKSSVLGNNDYYLQASETSKNEINNQLAIYDGDKDTKVNLLGNGGFSFKLPSNSKRFSLPFMYYHGIDYQVKLDGKNVKGYPNKNALMTINNVGKGKHHVQIIVHKTKAEIASYILSLIGLLILIGTILKNFLKKRKNK